MYDVADALPSAPVSALEPGTCLLVSGPTRETHALTIDLLAMGPEREETAMLISTNEPAGTVLEAFETHGALISDLVGVVDCTTGEGESATGHVPVSYLSSPGDLTGLSLEVAKLVETLNPTRLRIGLSTISTMLMYTEVETTFRFLHVFCSRIRTGGWLGVFTIDPGMHEPEAHNTIRALFDAEVVLDETGREFRGL